MSLIEPNLAKSLKFENSVLSATLHLEGYISVVIKPQQSLTLDDLIFFTDSGLALCKAHGVAVPIPVLVDLSKARSMDKPARNYASSEVILHKKVALLTKSPMSKIIGNFFVGLTKSKHPLQLFTDEQLAKAWLFE